MPEIRTVTTLRRKRDEISASIRLYERQLAQARADLAAVTSAIKIFEATGDPKDMSSYFDTHRLFRYGETWAICSRALADRGGPMTTRELTVAVMKAKGFDTGDRVLAKGISYSLIRALSQRRQRRQVNMIGASVTAFAFGNCRLLRNCRSSRQTRSPLISVGASGYLGNWLFPPARADLVIYIFFVKSFNYLRIENELRIDQNLCENLLLLYDWTHYLRRE